ncbi:MAG TPA: malto-oligosyltrehalose synthase [Casimicrobiaceae bacterium]|nr:malto-oligosyltrehalose synthase [Casimicrobiaceae bacterium]
MKRRADAVPLPVAAIPRATYRVQLSRDFTFDDVTALAPYFAALGISHVYCSPYLRARPGSTHGYDIIDHRMLNPEIGSRADFDRMVEALAREGMSHLCDVVPNHMAVMGGDNAWWMDVLANGASSRYASFFDIDWNRHGSDLAGKVLVPVLGDAYGTVLESGLLRLEFDARNGTFAIAYYDHRFPIDPRCYAEILLAASSDARGASPPGNVSELESIAYTLKALPPHDETSPARIAARRRLGPDLSRRLAALVRRDARIGDAIAQRVVRFNGTAGERDSFDALHALLEAQPFRLAHWRVASDEINYRRFFDINELGALRMEEPDVFDATHAFVLGLAADGVIGGLRIDHPDGLFDPKGYFEALQRRYRAEVAARTQANERVQRGIYVVIEKIAASHERMHEDWPVQGTTGYRFANVVNGLFVDTRAKARIDRIWRAFVGDEARGFDEACYEGRRAIMEGPLASELRVLTLRALRLARADRRTRDFTFNTLRKAIIEVAARFPVYRTYVDADGASSQDRRHVGWAVGHARARSRTSDPTVLDFLQRALLGEPGADAPASAVAAYCDFAMRFQQFTAPVAAKGVEDTALYRFNRLVSLNEVGGDPEQFGITLRAFHAASADRAARWPHTMLATSTHDNKRSEDVRARIDAISEMPAVWRSMLRRYRTMNRSRKTQIDDAPAPSRNDEYLLYQTLVGTYPPERMNAQQASAYRERITSYMRKAAREAKVHTSWLAPNAAYEAALDAFVGALLGDEGERLFLPDLRRECATFAWLGLLSSLAMALLKVASPGVPDIYQGNELVDYALVDPDNRHPVDYAARRERLASLARIGDDASTRAAALRALFDPPFDGRAKLFVLSRGFALRRAHPALFASGDYRPIHATGTHAEHVVAFARMHDGEGVIAAAGRLYVSRGLTVGALPIGSFWRDTALDLPWLSPNAMLTDALGGEAFAAGSAEMPLARLFQDFPGALLHFRISSG